MAVKSKTAVDEAAGVSTVGKAIEVLDLISDFGRPVRFKEIEAASRFPKPTLYRFVQTLTDHGMLGFDPDRNTYFIGVHLMRLAHAAWHHSMIGPAARPHLHALARQLGESAYLSRLDGGHCVCLDRGSADDLAGVFQDVNRVYPSYCTAVGKAMLACLPAEALDRALTQQSMHRLTETTITDEAALRADLDLTRKRGFAIENEEHIRGIIAVAVPIVSAGGNLLGGIGVHAPDRRTDLAKLKGHVPKIQEAAEIISRDVAVWSFPETIHETANPGN